MAKYVRSRRRYPSAGLTRQSGPIQLPYRHEDDIIFSMNPKRSTFRLSKPKEIYCPSCDSKDIIKAGTRKIRFRKIQRYSCKRCHRQFTDKRLKDKSYPAKIILEAISLYNLGHSQENVTKIIAKRYKSRVPRRTISDWVREYSNPCTYYALRKEAVKLYKPQEIILSEKLQHGQVYNFKVHLAKLGLFEKRKILPEEKLKALRGYLERITDKGVKGRPFPHHIFTIAPENTHQETVRAHGAIRRIPDSKLFHGGQEKRASKLNIDLLQIRNGLIYILDYKPGAGKITPIGQLAVYALALAARTKLRVKDFKCAWFDERDYFEFWPLEAVYEKHW